LPLAADDLARMQALVGRAEERERVVAVPRVRRPAEGDSNSVRLENTLESHAHPGRVVRRRARREDGELARSDTCDLVPGQQVLREPVAEVAERISAHHGRGFAD